jgi:aryl-alcohol dehydrogenase-like predicted oxidoreductase
MKPIADKYNATLAQVIINWTVQQPGIGCVLVGARSEKQVKDNAGALGFTLSAEDLAEIRKSSEKFELAG